MVGGELSLKSQIASAHLDFVNQTNSILDIDEIRIEFYDNTTETLICTIENSIFLERIGSGEKHSEYVMDTWGLPALLPPGHSYKADIYVDSEFIISVPLYSGVVNEYTYFKVENGKALPLFE